MSAKHEEIQLQSAKHALSSPVGMGTPPPAGEPRVGAQSSVGAAYIETNATISSDEAVTLAGSGKKPKDRSLANSMLSLQTPVSEEVTLSGVGLEAPPRCGDQLSVGNLHTI